VAGFRGMMESEGLRQERLPDESNRKGGQAANVRILKDFRRGGGSWEMCCRNGSVRWQGHRWKTAPLAERMGHLSNRGRKPFKANDCQIFRCCGLMHSQIARKQVSMRNATGKGKTEKRMFRKGERFCRRKGGRCRRAELGERSGHFRR